MVAVTDVYIWADTIQKERLDAVITLQKYWRRWLARKVFVRKRNKALARVLWDEEQEKLKIEEEIKWLEELEHRRRHPCTKDDFALLFSDLQKWWNHESSTLKETKSGPDLKAALYTLLDKEVCKMQEIEVKRQEVIKLDCAEQRQVLLHKASAPKLWEAYKGPILVETAGTQRARSLRDLYITLSKPKLVTEDRISALMQLKEVIEPYGCPLIKNLTSLANREIDLLMRGTKEKHLLGLRARIRNLVWQFTRQPAFNPETQHFSRICRADGRKPLVLLCSSCNLHYMLPPDTLEEAADCSVLQERFTKCKKCKYLENEGWIRKDLELYKRMLKLLRDEEEKKANISGLIYLLQPHDLSYMVETIWKSQSCLSGLMVLKDLEFIRWNVKKSWTPWNCIFVTREEACLHKRLENYKEFYDKKLSLSVQLKHIQARSYFSHIPRFLPYLQLPYTDSDYDVYSGDEDST